MRIHSFSWREWAVVGMFVFAAAVVTWGLMIRPHNYDWVTTGETTAVIETVLPSKTVIGTSDIKVLVRLPDGSGAIVNLPPDSLLDEGCAINLIIMTDPGSPKAIKYVYSSFSAG